MPALRLLQRDHDHEQADRQGTGDGVAHHPDQEDAGLVRIVIGPLVHPAREDQIQHFCEQHSGIGRKGHDGIEVEGGQKRRGKKDSLALPDQVVTDVDVILQLPF